jgi:type IV pilus assembly protein PilB
MDIFNPRIPHDGRIKYIGGIGEIDVRVSTLPLHREDPVIMRQLVCSEVVGDLLRLGLEEEDYDLLSICIHRTYGLIVATDSTGSGKTTTL